MCHGDTARHIEVPLPLQHFQLRCVSDLRVVSLRAIHVEFAPKA